MCFAILAALQAVTPGFFASRWGALCNLALALLWGSSLLFGRPLTQDYSGRNYPAAVTGTWLFRHINTVLTRLWTAIFALQSVVVSSSIQ